MDKNIEDMNYQELMELQEKITKLKNKLKPEEKCYISLKEIEDSLKEVNPKAYCKLKMINEKGAWYRNDISIYRKIEDCLYYICDIFYGNFDIIDRSSYTNTKDKKSVQRKRNVPLKIAENYRETFLKMFNILKEGALSVKEELIDEELKALEELEKMEEKSEEPKEEPQKERPKAPPTGSIVKYNDKIYGIAREIPGNFMM